MNILDLPQELLHHIFTFLTLHDLPRSALVCHRFHQAIDDDHLWRLPSLWRQAGCLSAYRIRLAKVHDRNLRQLADYPVGKWKTAFKKRYLLELRWRFDEPVVQMNKSNQSSVSCMDCGVFNGVYQAVTGSSDNDIYMWDLNTGKLLTNFAGHNAPVLSLKFDENKVVSGSFDGSIRVWSKKSEKCVKIIPAHRKAVTCLQYDHVKMISGSMDSTVKVWQMSQSASAKCVATLNHSRPVICLGYAANKSEMHPGRLLVGCGTGCDIESSENGILSPARSSRTSSGKVTVWDLPNGKKLRSLRKPLVGCPRAIALDASASGKIAIGTQSESTNLFVFDFETGKHLNTLKGHLDSVTSVQMDGNKLVSGSEDGTIRLWDMSTGKSVRTYTGHNWGVRGIYFSNSVLVSGSYGELYRWDFMEQQKIIQNGQVVPESTCSIC
eukprot:TRINITY_DN12722_c0_g1_i1.p1 TRINITY_DN12722_c0_g1~~TRINITY_DN12722_c0_g1_i1.p1  ORF type:complete len:438 (+),score=106.62 TRINITY_DN12722_c0_g1_i1:1-1314(+)